MHAASLDFASLIRDRLVVVAAPPKAFSAKLVMSAGARGVLTLRRDGLSARSPEGCAAGTFKRPSDIARNNCSVAILFGTAGLVLADKRYFANFEHVLVSTAGALMAGPLGLARYGARGALRVDGTAAFPDEQGRATTFVVFKTKAKPTVRSRLYGPAGPPLATLQNAADLDQVLLRSIESIEAGTHAGDVDILISARDVEAFRERLCRGIGTRPYDVYTEAAELGYSYKRVPCFKPELARKMLASAEVRESGLKAPDAKWRYLAFCYHVLFHDKLAGSAAAAAALDVALFRKPAHHAVLLALAQGAGTPPPATIEDLEAALKAADGFPGLDLLAFYAEHSAFVQARYIDSVAAPPGLAVFYVRDFGQGSASLDAIRAHLARAFSVLAEGPVTDANREAITRGVRGGNWSDKRGPGGLAPPIHWFVCWDKAPRRPSALLRWRYPRLDNANLRMKADLRKLLGSEAGRAKPFGVVHASDNTVEALEHLKHLGVEQNPEIVRLGLSAATRAPSGRAAASG